MSIKHHVIIIPGLGNNIAACAWTANGWRKYGITPYIFNAKWKGEENGVDEVVPSSTVPIHGANNITTFSIGHVLSMALNMTLSQKYVIDFILR